MKRVDDHAVSHAAFDLAHYKKICGVLDFLADLLKRSEFTLERKALTAKEFYEQYYFLNRPVVLSGLMDAWPARSLWTPDYLREQFGHVLIEIMYDRDSDARYDENIAKHRGAIKFGDYVELITSGSSNDVYLVARNNALRNPGLAPMRDHFQPPHGFLTPDDPTDSLIRLWIGPAGTITPLHHDLSNSLFAQVHGRKRWKIISPTFSHRLENNRTVYSDLDLSQPGVDVSERMLGVKVFETILEPGEFLFVPIGWWHWVEALDVSISLSFQNFLHNEPRMTWSDAIIE